MPEPPSSSTPPAPPPATTRPAGGGLRFARAADGPRIAWVRSGRGPPLVRVAHWLTHVEREPRTAIWRPWLEHYARVCTLYRYDERGYGMSDPDPRPATLESCVNDLASVIEASGEARVALFAISGAASTAIAYAVSHPQRVSRLIVLGGYLAGIYHRQVPPSAVQWYDAQLTLMEFGWDRSDPLVQQFLTSQLIPDATPEEARALNELSRMACDGRQASAFLRTRAGFDVSALAASVLCPTLVLHADHDRIVPLPLGRELAASIPGARFETLGTRNHVPTGSDPALGSLFDKLDAFLREDWPAAVTMSPRTRELAALVAEGLDNRQIGARMGIRDKTVRNALSALYAQLGVEGRPQAIHRLRAMGFGPR
ncbi:MAG: alpha/beta fold hydrolase [Burkholderiaceae bacterium]